MSHSHDQDRFSAELEKVADALRDGRPKLDPLTLDGIKVRAMAAARRSDTSRQKGTAMKQRLTTVLAAAFLVLGTGGTFALAGGGDGQGSGGSASYHQYRPECPPGYVLQGKHCRPIPPPHCPPGFEVSGDKCVPTPPPTCPPGYEVHGRFCRPIPVPRCPHGFVFEEGSCHQVGHGGGDKGGGDKGGGDKGGQGSGGDKGGSGGDKGGGDKGGGDKGHHHQHG